DFKGLLTHLNCGSLRLPHNDSETAETYLQLGYVPLPHFMRAGDRTVSWYHSPLATGPNTDESPLPATAADQLVRFSRANGMFDVSYAAAWELGRLLVLQSKQTSVSLYQWKRMVAQQANRVQQRLMPRTFRIKDRPPTFRFLMTQARGFTVSAFCRECRSTIW